MRLYHYLNAKYGLKDVAERRLKISRITELNDPFEFLGVDLSDRDFRKAMRATKETLSANRGIICFSKTRRNPVQWTHYADRHKGICLAFDVSDRLLSRVKYVEKRITDYGKVDYALMERILTTKFSHWAYEEEYRLFVALEDEESGFYYADFSDDMKLKEVIVGSRSPATRDQVTNALGQLASEVISYKVRPAFKSFRIIRNQNESLWK